jgi:hypothetical protein
VEFSENFHFLKIQRFLFFFFASLFFLEDALVSYFVCVEFSSYFFLNFSYLVFYFIFFVVEKGISFTFPFFLAMSPAAAAVSPARLRLPVPPPEPLSGDESSSSFSSITDAKMRIKALEQEASNMQAHFSQYRRYVTAQFHSPSTPLDEHAQPAKSFSSNFTRGQVDVQGRPEVPRKLLLTHYLIQDPKTYNNGPGFLSGPPTPPKLASSSSGERDLGLSTRSLKMELREAEEKERFSAREENISANPKEEPEPVQVQLDFESKIDADVRELMAAASAKDSSSPGLDMELGW